MLQKTASSYLLSLFRKLQICALIFDVFYSCNLFSVEISVEIDVFKCYCSPIVFERVLIG